MTTKTSKHDVTGWRRYPRGIILMVLFAGAGHGSYRGPPSPRDRPARALRAKSSATNSSCAMGCSISVKARCRTRGCWWRITRRRCGARRSRSRRARADGVSRGWFRQWAAGSGRAFLWPEFSHGQRVRWFANGQRRSLEHIENGKVVGTYTEWYDNGQKSVGDDDARRATRWRGGGPGIGAAHSRAGTRMDRGKILERQFFDDSVVAR